MKLPLARNSGIVVQGLGKELLIYNLTTHKAYQLNETSMIVYHACGRGASFADLKRRHQFTDDLIYLALDQLKDEGLIKGYESKFAALSRRDVMKRVGLTTALALPVIAAIVAPAAAHAASGSGCAGSCIGRGAEICQGRAAGTYSYTFFRDSTNGTCSGPAAGPYSVTCPNGGFAYSDLCIS